MKRFAELYAELDETTKIGAKVDVLAALRATALDLEELIRPLRNRGTLCAVTAGRDSRFPDGHEDAKERPD